MLFGLVSRRGVTGLIQLSSLLIGGAAFYSPSGSIAMSGLKAAERLMKDVYGDWEELLPRGLFPRPMPVHEAGPSVVPYGGECQRRYLWTDAFGVLNLLTIAHRSQEAGEEDKRARALEAARALITTVHATLGQPRSADLPMAPGDDTPFGYKGLRIGKTEARRRTDAGMTYDGMYYHYLDKWIFALLRYSQESGDGMGLREAVRLIKAIHPAFMARYPPVPNGRPFGVYWKVNSDLTRIPELEGMGASEDALSGWLVYSLVRHHELLSQADKEEGRRSSIEDEWREMGEVAAQYVQRGMRVSTDPLGYGLIGWKSQWLGGWADPVRARLKQVASIALEVESGMQLPFRLYGALLGARLMEHAPDINRRAEAVLGAVLPFETRTPVGAPHSTINKVMLATALDPQAFARRREEPTLDMPSSSSGAAARQTKQ